jgi:hypothetical protein
MYFSGNPSVNMVLSDLLWPFLNFRKWELFDFFLTVSFHAAVMNLYLFYHGQPTNIAAVFASFHT